MLPLGNGSQSALKVTRRLLSHERILCRTDVAAPRALIMGNLTAGVSYVTATLANVLTTWPVLFS